MPPRRARSAPPPPHREPEYDAIASKPPAPPKDPPALKKLLPLRKRSTAPKHTSPAIPSPPGTPRKKAVAAGPLRGRARPRAAESRAAEESSRLDALQRVIVGSLEDDKAENIITIELSGRASFADRMVVATGLADRQITAMATHLEEKLEEAGLDRVQIEGGTGSDWVLIDAGDIVVHLFKPEARSMYALERMWGAELDEDPPAAG